MNGKTVAITGIGGFIGRHLARVLHETFPEAAIVGLGRGRTAAEGQVFDIDLLDGKCVRDSLDQIRSDFIFHLAGVVYSRDWRELHCGNVQTTINILEAVEELGLAPRVIIPGSAAEYGAVSAAELPLVETQVPNPVTPYGVTKVCQTSVARYYATRGVDVVIGRVFNVIGLGAPETLSIGAFVSQLRRIKHAEIAPKIMVGNLKPRRDLVDIQDVCHALLALAMTGQRGEIYNVCSGRSVSMEFVLGELIGRLGIDVTITVDPARIRSTEIADTFGSNRKICDVAGWKPTLSISDSVASILAGL